jgi:hypothetical protein
LRHFGVLAGIAPIRSRRQNVAAVVALVVLKHSMKEESVMIRVNYGSFRLAFSVALALLLVAGCGALAFAGTDAVLYDVDFDGPPHVVGSAPAYGAGPFTRHTPTAGGQIFQPLGIADVVAASGVLANKPVRLTALDGTPNDPILGGVDLQFNLDPLYNPFLGPLDVFHAQVDEEISEIATSAGFGIFWDSPAIHKVEFSPDGNIRIKDALGTDLLIGPYAPRTLYTVRMGFDRAAATWSASINGNPIYAGPLEDTDLEMFRIAMTTGDSSTTSVVFVDNIKITAVVPEPGTLFLTVGALAGVLLARRRVA